MSMPFGIRMPMLPVVSAAVLIAVALPIAACGSSSSQSTSAPGTSPAAPVTSSPASGASTAGITDCSDHTVVQPKSLTLACGDGSVNASGLVWQDWGQATSTGHGIISVKVCDPNCASGTKTQQEPGTVTANRLQVCPDGRQRYTRLTYDYSGNAAGPVTMTIQCPPYQP